MVEAVAEVNESGGRKKVFSLTSLTGKSKHPLQSIATVLGKGGREPGVRLAHANLIPWGVVQINKTQSSMYIACLVPHTHNHVALYVSQRSYCGPPLLAGEGVDEVPMGEEVLLLLEGLTDQVHNGPRHLLVQGSF